MRALKQIRSRSVFSGLTRGSFQYYITIIILMFSFCFEAQNITKFEYFIGNDPGFGNGTEVLATTPGSEVTQNLTIPISGVASGFNRLSIRALDGANWSLYHAITFYISDFTGSAPISNLKGAEYWFDSDTSTALAITGNPSALTESFVIPLGTLSAGFHTLNIRIQNLDDTWSLYDKKTFYVSYFAGSAPISNLKAAEYWFDTDPGLGNGTDLAITGNPSALTENLVIPLGTLSAGFHILNIRIQNLDDTWSLYDNKRFYVVDNAVFASPPVAALSEVEILYDAELGFGSGTPLPFTPTGNPDEYLVEIPTDMVTCDIHDVSLSMKNADGNYSLYQIAETIDVFDNLPPTIVVFPNITAELDASGQASITLTDVDNGTFDDCDLVSVVLNQAQFDYTCADLGLNSVTMTATDAEDKVSNQDVDITVVDLIEPVAIAQDITVQLDGTGNVTITGAQINNGSTDNCSVTGFSLDVSSFDCTNLGANTVNLTVSDSSGNTNSTSAAVTVEDSIKPTVITQGITVQLDASGNTSITATQIDNGSSDNCTINTRSLDVTAFTCANLGANTVTLTVTDQSGNVETGTATVTVEDSINPTVVAQNITVQLDATGNASIIASQIENGSSDNCAIASSSLDVTSFTCANLGSNTVTLSVTDTSGNTGTNTATVTVEDNINPVAITQAFTAQLDASGNVTITADDVDNSSTDNCAVTTKSLDISSFTCTNLGTNTVMLTVEDASGNTNTASATVTVEDSVNPTVVTQNITVQLDATGNASITASQIENGSSDNCAIASNSLDVTSFTCANLGSNTVTLSVTDTSGNTGTNTATVTVEDNINPVAITKAFTAQLDASGNVTITGDDVDNSSTDNCAVTTKSLDVSSFTCADIGANTVMLTVGDASGNTNTASATVTVEDSVNPVAIGQGITRDLAGNASLTIIASEVDNGSSDNCSATSLSIDVDTFTTPGDYPVVLTVTDGSNNLSSTTITVTIEDTSLGVEEFEISADNILLYPNPSKGDIFISTKLIIDSVDIYDVDGKHINSVIKPGTKIDFERISSGMYFLKFKIENTIVTKRVVKE